MVPVAPVTVTSNVEPRLGVALLTVMLVTLFALALSVPITRLNPPPAVQSTEALAEPGRCRYTVTVKPCAVAVAVGALRYQNSDPDDPSDSDEIRSAAGW